MTGLGPSDAPTLDSPGQQEFRGACLGNGNDPQNIRHEHENYPTTNILELTKTKVNKKKIILELVNIYEEFIKKVSKLSLTTIKNL